MKILISVLMVAVAVYFVVTLGAWRKKAKKEQYRESLKSELEHLLISYLDHQLFFFKDPEGRVSKHARDNFSLGYICGTIDAALQYKKITTISQEELTFTILPELFGHEHALTTIGRTIYLTENNDAEYLEGCNTGGNDFFDFADGKIRNSLSWLIHLNKKTD